MPSLFPRHYFSSIGCKERERARNASPSIRSWKEGGREGGQQACCLPGRLKAGRAEQTGTDGRTAALACPPPPPSPPILLYFLPPLSILLLRLLLLPFDLRPLQYVALFAQCCSARFVQDGRRLRPRRVFDHGVSGGRTPI